MIIFLGGLGQQSVVLAFIFAVTMLCVAALLRVMTYPRGLTPFTQIFLALLPALVAAGVGALLVASGLSGPAATELLGASVAAVLVALAVELLRIKIMTAWPVRAAVLGSAAFAASLERELTVGGRSRSTKIIGWLDVEPGQHDPRDDRLSEDALASIRAAVNEYEIDLLVRSPEQSGGRVSRSIYDQIALGCVDLPVRLIDGSQFYEQTFGHVPLGTIGTDWFLYMMHPNFEKTSQLSKRMFDLVVSTAAAAVALPVIGVAAAAIKLSDGGSVFFRQRRIGEGGREFEIVKLRTMREDAERTGAQWSAPRDPRVTLIGRILRRSHVDELPQLINVLRGDMTLVGPRPERPEMIAELEQLFPHYKRRLLVKPGVTGWAQIRCGYAGTELGTAWKLCHDLYYLKHQSLLVDVLIIGETLLTAARDSQRPVPAPDVGFLVSPEWIGGLVGADVMHADRGERLGIADDNPAYTDQAPRRTAAQPLAG